MNLHDHSLEFEPIHRVVFGVDPRFLVDELVRYYPNTLRGEGPATEQRRHVLRYVWAEEEGAVTVLTPRAQLAVGTLQTFLDEFLAAHPQSRIDYVHGADVARKLARERKDAIAFLLPAMDKEELFPTVIHDGVLPRKTFSMGEAHDKRFYLEARRIRR